MAKKKYLPSKYKSSKKSQSKKARIFKLVLPWLIVIIVGFITFILLFPELIQLLPFEPLVALALFGEKMALFLKNFFVGLFTNVAVISSISALVLIFLVIKFLPFYPVEDSDSYTRKKLFLPYFRKMSILVVSSSTTNSNNNFSHSTYANKVHQAFISCLSLKAKERMLAIYKHNTGVSLFFPVVAKGWFRKKVEQRLNTDIIFVTTSVDTHYDSKIKTLDAHQTKEMVKNLNLLKAKSKIDFSSDLITQINLTDQMYNILLKNETKDTCFIIKTEKKRKEAKKVVFNLLLISEDKTTESFVLNASGLAKKKRKIIPLKASLNKLLFSSIHSKQPVEINDLASLVHVPHTYRGGSIPVKTKDEQALIANLSQNKDTIVIGRAVDDEEIGNEITLEIKDLLLNAEVYGMIGRGKTKLISTVVGQLIEKKTSTLIFDIKGEYARTFVDDPRVEIYTIGRPHPLCINIFETDDEDDIHNTLLIIEEMLLSSKKEFTPSMKNLFESALLLTHRSPKRNLSVFVENIFKVSKQLQSHSNTTYLQQTIDAVLNRLNFIFNPINFEILGTARTTLDLSFLEGGKSIILDLSQFQRRAARPSDIFLVCNLILKMLYRHASAKEMTNKLRYMVILEEAINIIPNFYHSESSASLITAENNFLLGRSIGIGHITISQMWQSVSNIVHGNSATKFVFRSSEKTDLIARALNIDEDEIAKIQRLPTQHCFLFFEGSESAIEIRTLDLLKDPISYAESQSKMMKRYGRSVFPLLYNNFIDMRTALYQQSSRNPATGVSSRSAKSKKDDYPQDTLDQYLIEEASKPDTEQQNKIVVEQDTLDLITSAGLLPENLICERLCPEKDSNRDCLKYNMGAKIVKSTIINECSSEEISLLLNNEDKMQSLISAISTKRNLEFDDILVFCTVKTLALDFASRT